MKDTIMYGIVHGQNYAYDNIKKIKGRLSKEDGVTAIEYAVIAVAVSAMLLTVFGTGKESFITVITEKFNKLSDNIKGTIN
ncbi:Flp family type IVb pilin [Rosenbergiella collisarenosi]|uniref:Flp family type IVb pilin n=1 Tax=Rosenbergiella collisarenosi TaxID=1544695 RepID=UPI001F4F27FD|nr:Flp family type IVb pilin [Rosenbergiella collisarenosi]